VCGGLWLPGPRPRAVLTRVASSRVLSGLLSSHGCVHAMQMAPDQPAAIAAPTGLKRKRLEVETALPPLGDRPVLQVSRLASSEAV
jgi:hypothetical protein